MLSAQHTPRRSPNRWRWNAGVAAAGAAARLTVLPHEAVLLNSLRRLLSVVPQTEHTIARWAGGPAPAPGTPSVSGHPSSPATQGERQLCPGEASFQGLVGYLTGAPALCVSSLSWACHTAPQEVTLYASLLVSEAVDLIVWMPLPVKPWHAIFLAASTTQHGG